jgi:hypothetical protein
MPLPAALAAPRTIEYKLRATHLDEKQNYVFQERYDLCKVHLPSSPFSAIITV